MRCHLLVLLAVACSGFMWLAVAPEGGQALAFCCAFVQLSTAAL